MTPGRRLPAAWYARDALEVAPDLLGKLLAGPDGRLARIVEVEAYRGGDDPGSHAYRGRTARNAVMWGPAGHLYVYLIYGMHHCANVVCGADGEAQAVLLRAARPEGGLGSLRAARFGARNGADRDLCRGPGRLAQAFGLTRADNDADLSASPEGAPGRLSVLDDGTPPPAAPLVTVRIGLSAGAELPWRFAVAGEPTVSGPGALRGDRPQPDGPAV